MKRPVLLIRPRELESFLPYRRSSLKVLVKKLCEEGILKKVKLQPTGHAVAFTEDSVLRVQEHLMGLSGVEVVDDEQTIVRVRRVRTERPRPSRRRPQIKHKARRP
jgi:hypothetical protein